MELETGTVTLAILVLVQAGALFYWGGKTSQVQATIREMLKDHEFRIRDLERPGKWGVGGK